MAQPMTLKQLTTAYDKWGVRYRIIGDPEKHRRDPGHGAWGPVYGIGDHHTGDDAPDTADRRVISDGRAGLPGPLAQNGVNDDGIVDIHSIGRSNHFGGGDPDVLRAVINESYGAYPPHTDKHQGEPGAVDGNRHFYGFETYYSGKKKMTAAAYNALLRANAAICDFHGWTEKSAIGHKEWSDWKIDPGQLDMADFRRDLGALLKAGPGKPQVAKPPVRIIRTPNITAAINAGIAYEKVLSKITDPQGKALATKAIKQIKADRKVLREQERK